MRILHNATLPPCPLPACLVSISFWNITVPEIYVATPSGPMPHLKREYKIITSPDSSSMRIFCHIVQYFWICLLLHGKENSPLSQHEKWMYTHSCWQLSFSQKRLENFGKRLFAFISLPDEILSTVFITLVLRPSLTVTCSLERSWIPPTPNLSPHISLYWLGWCSYCSHKVIKYKCPGHLEVVSRPKVIVSNSPSWLSSHLILLSDPWERQCTTKCRGWSNPLKHLNIKEQLVCCEQNSFWLLHPPPHQPAPSCRDGSWIVQTGETGFNQKEVETGSMGGAPQGV